jgi:hypothetical protein
MDARIWVARWLQRGPQRVARMVRRARFTRKSVVDLSGHNSNLCQEHERDRAKKKPTSLSTEDLARLKYQLRYPPEKLQLLLEYLYSPPRKGHEEGPPKLR